MYDLIGQAALMAAAARYSTMALSPLDRKGMEAQLFQALRAQVPPEVLKRSSLFKAEKKGDSADIYLYGVIGQTFWGDGISATKIKDELAKLGNVKTINIHINSEGGDVFEGRAIYTQLHKHSARKIVHVDGLAASIASLIAMAGDEIRMGEGTMMMIHNAWTIALGDAAELAKVVALLQSIDNTLVDSYVLRTKNKGEKVRKWMEADTWFTAAEAHKEGFCDVIDEPVRAAAMLRDSAMAAARLLYRNAPTRADGAKAIVAELMARQKAARAA